MKEGINPGNQKEVITSKEKEETKRREEQKDERIMKLLGTGNGRRCPKKKRDTLEAAGGQT